MEFVVLALLIGLVPATIAHNKGHNFVSWWIFGALLFIIALPMAITLKPGGDKRPRCTSCGALSRGEAACWSCGRQEQTG